MSVCLSTHLSQEPRIRPSPSFQCMLPAAMARPCSGGVVMLCTSGFVADVMYVYSNWQSGPAPDREQSLMSTVYISYGFKTIKSIFKNYSDKNTCYAITFKFVSRSLKCMTYKRQTNKETLSCQDHSLRLIKIQFCIGLASGQQYF